MPPSPTHSHFVPYFTRTRGMGRYRQERAVCGAWIDPATHTVLPSCPQCQAWLVSDTAEAERLAAKWDAEEEKERHVNHC